MSLSMCMASVGEQSKVRKADRQKYPHELVLICVKRKKAKVVNGVPCRVADDCILSRQQICFFLLLFLSHLHFCISISFSMWILWTTMNWQTLFLLTLESEVSCRQSSSACIPANLPSANSSYPFPRSLFWLAWNILTFAVCFSLCARSLPQCRPAHTYDLFF